MAAAPQIDPDVTEALAQFADFRVGPDTLETLRTTPITEPVELSDDVERTDHTFPGATGAPDVTVRVHRPRGTRGTLPCVYSIHGGGYVIGSYSMDDARFDSWCPRLQCVGVSVEYRLSPETAYPGPLDDCYAGLAWVHAHAGELGIDPARIGILGASAGGGLAAGLALLARDRGEIPVAFQVLVYPMIDDRQITPSSQVELPIWNPSANEFGWRAYLGPLYGTNGVPPYAAPSRATALEGLPPAYVMVGTADGFHDEDVDYALRLNAAGVPTELHLYPGAPHGFDMMMADAPVAKRARQSMEAWVEHHLHR
ncbi:MAG: alpha/beta hydrolase [Acidimicrobiaceae bacterium]|nr:alpha/beta hydrolase [Acidimicrobiaceae bacterium]